MAKYGRAKKYDEKDGYWFSTENGAHIHVEEGQTPREAVDETFKRAKANNAQVDRENAEREKLYVSDEERWGNKEPQSYNGAKARRNPNFDEKEYGEFFDERGVLKEGKEDEYFEKVERNKVNKLKDVIEELDNRGVLPSYNENEVIDTIYEKELDGELGDFEEYVGDALKEYLKGKIGETKQLNKEQVKKLIDNFYDEVGDEDHREVIENAKKVEIVTTPDKYGWNTLYVDGQEYGRINSNTYPEGLKEVLEEEPSTEESTPTKTTDNRISDARKRLKDAGLKDNLSDETIELILKTFGR